MYYFLLFIFYHATKSGKGFSVVQITSDFQGHKRKTIGTIGALVKTTIFWLRVKHSNVILLFVYCFKWSNDQILY